MAEFEAQTTTEIDPKFVDPLVYGHHRSTPDFRGNRNWHFEIENGRDSFLSAVNAGAFRKPKTVQQKRFW